MFVHYTGQRIFWPILTIKLTKKEKSRYFTFLLYPESIPNDWELRLETLGFPIAISPLYDRDKKEGQEKGLKKPHYHAIYYS